MKKSSCASLGGERRLVRQKPALSATNLDSPSVESRSTLSPNSVPDSSTSRVLIAPPSPSLSRARSAPEEGGREEIGSTPTASSVGSTGPIGGAGSFDGTLLSMPPLFATAVDCRRTTLNMSGNSSPSRSGSHLICGPPASASSVYRRRNSGLSCSGSSSVSISFGYSSVGSQSFGDEADQEDNDVYDEEENSRDRDDHDQDGDDEDEGDDNEARAGRRLREALISVKEEVTLNLKPAERKGYRRRHRPSISFEDSVPTIPRQRQKQLQFLRTVHSAQARLPSPGGCSSSKVFPVTNDSPTPSSKGSSSSPMCETASSSKGIMRESGLIKLPRPGCLEGTLKVAENDEDDENDDSIGGLGRRIRKLSSRTIEFCDSIDNIQNDKSPSTSTAPVPPPLSTTSTSSIKLPSATSPNSRPPTLSSTATATAKANSIDQKDTSPQSDQKLLNTSTETTNTVILSPAVSLDVETEVECGTLQNPKDSMGNAEIKSEKGDQLFSKYISDIPKSPMNGRESKENFWSNNKNSLNSVSVDSTVSGDSFNDKQPFSQQSTQQGGTSNSRFMNYMRGGGRSLSKQDANNPSSRKPDGNNSGKGSSFSETISHFASSIMSGRLKHPISSSNSTDGHIGIKRRPFENDNNSSTERPLGLPISSGIFSKLRQNTVAVSRDIDQTDPGSTSSRGRKPFKRQDTPRVHEDDTEAFTAHNQKRRPSPIRVDGKGRSYQHVGCKRSAFSADSSSSGSQSFGTGEHFTPPSISIVCTDDPDPRGYYGSPPNSPSYDSFTPRNMGSMDTDSRDTDTPVLDEFAQFLNASIHPPNELSLPRCYPDPTPYQKSSLAAPMTAPNSRRSSASSRGAFTGNGNRSLSLGYHQQQQAVIAGLRHRPSSGSSSARYTRLPSLSVTSSNGEETISTTQTHILSPSSPSTNRPQLRRGSAQDLGDGIECSSGRLKLTLPQKSQPPPDLKIDLLSESSGASSPFSKGPSLSPNGTGDEQTNKSFAKCYGTAFLSAESAGCRNGDPQRRHSHSPRTPQIMRNKSAPVTPLNRSTYNVNHIHRSPSKEGYLMVPGSRQRGSSLPEPREREEEGADLYRLRAFTVSNKRIISRSDSLQPRHCRSSNSINSSASSLTFSHSGRSSLRSSTEEDERESSRNSSWSNGRVPRHTVLMLGASDVGKSYLTSQFMSSNDVSAYGNEEQFEEYGEKCVNVLLDGEEAELVFIDHPTSEISVENALSTYMPDAMVIVYSVVSSESFHVAEEILQYLWRSGSSSEKAVILVGNKADLVRTRTVTIVEAKSLATSFDCKYTETSASLNHNVDELLVGILTQIRLKSAERNRQTRRRTGSRARGMFSGSPNGLTVPGGSSPGGPLGRRKSAGVRVRSLIDKVLGGDSKSKSCDDLHVL